MNAVGRIIGYLCGALSASVFYVLWIVLNGYFTDPLPNITLHFAVAILFWFSSGFGFALVLNPLPWFLVVLGFHKLRYSGPVLFTATGTVLTVVVGAAVSSLTPKPLGIEDQTFLEGLRIAVERQGLCFLLAGTLLGLTYWVVAERNTTLYKKERS